MIKAIKNLILRLFRNFRPANGVRQVNDYAEDNGLQTIPVTVDRR